MSSSPSSRAGSDRFSKMCSRAIALLLASLLFPFVLLSMLRSPRSRRYLEERLGKGAWQQPAMRNADIWIHGASVGEIGGLEPLLEVLQRSYPGKRIVISTTSVTGREKAASLVGPEHVALIPLDHPLILSPVLGRVSPKLVIITETELWPNLLFALDARGIPVVLINARISDYSFPWYRRVRVVLEPVVKLFAAVLAQTPLDQKRLIALGTKPEVTMCVGSTKFDRQAPLSESHERDSFARELGVRRDAPCFVAGSVRPGEDEQVLLAYLKTRARFPQLQLIITPRHPERFAETEALLKRHSLAFNKRSSGRPDEGTGVILLDTLGELQKAYALATFSFVGASLVDIGGHNPLEPAAFASPVLVGPYTSTVRDAVAALKQADGLIEVDSIETLASAMEQYCEFPAVCTAAGKRAQEVWRSNLGASERTMAELKVFLA